ncbi:major facilitator superfamily domain-containing protein 6-B-like [Adelges cooleyi]|uniref:major facilitator superfamily domain-containing protein 6-B-like n=1 Tax=Adelges cooleyi TaxID=133065 RepID=UPI00217F349C|nr:major facilitator superfamily domain-containing protein 6-B-like [Adelges cooleyi]
MVFFTINKKYLILKLSFFLFDGGTSPINPFLPPIARQRGVSVFIVGIIFTCLPILNVLIRPIIGYVTDRWQCRRSVFLGCNLINAIITPVIHFIPGRSEAEKLAGTSLLETFNFWLFLVVIMLRTVLYMIGDVLQDTIAIEVLGSESHKYGMQRVWGAIGWGLTSLLTGWCVDSYSAGQVQKNYLPAYLISTVLLTMHVIVGSQLKSQQQNRQQINIFKDVGMVISNVKVVTYLIWVAVAGMFTAYIWYYLLWHMEEIATYYHPERLPYIKTIQGFSYAIQCCIGEIPVFLMFSSIVKRIGHMKAFTISFGVFSFRFFLYSIIRDPLWMLPVELLNGLTFTMAFLSGISYAAKVSPPGTEGTLQGLFGMAFQGVGIASGCFLAGYTFETMGSLSAMRFISYIALFFCITQFVVNILINSCIRFKVKSKLDIVAVQE